MILGCVISCVTRISGKLLGSGKILLLLITYCGTTQGYGKYGVHDSFACLYLDTPVCT